MSGNPYPPNPSGCRYHPRIEHCPLYIASHEAFGDGCFRGLEAACAADRRHETYKAMLAKVQARDPRMVAIVAFNEQASLRRSQTQRNLSLLPGGRPH